jgi:5-methylcytosine-specific restriction endonuclease McrA
MDLTIYATRTSPYRKAADGRYRTNLRAARRAANLCLRCGAPADPIRETDLICLRCWFVHMARKATGSNRNGPVLQALWDAQHGRCAYTGAALVPGVNASLDHKLPRTRGGSSERENLQWVTTRINSMKNNLTHDEFVSLCRLIVGLG